MPTDKSEIKWYHGFAKAAKKLPDYMLAVFSLIIVGGLWLVPGSTIQPSKVYLKLTSSAVSFTLVETTMLGDGCDLDKSTVCVKQLDSLSFRPLGSVAVSSKYGEAWAQVNQSTSILEEIRIDSGNTVLIMQSGGLTTISTRGGDVRGRIGVNGSGQIEVGSGAFEPDTIHSFSLVGPEDLEFWASGTELGGLVFLAKFQEAFELSGVRIKNLEFTRPDLSDQDLVLLESSIEQGTLTLPEISKSVDIIKGEILSLHISEGLLVGLQVSEMIELYFVGTADQIKLGPKGYDHELTPSLLEFVYYREKWILLFSAIMFVFGTLRSIKKP
ncbi:MAG: hypothetical protein GY841_14605 [FCB group bacterium]|nr:hypothetical protein [FCB group bacterium]